MKPAKCLLILLCFGFVFFLVFGGSPPRATASPSQEGTLDPIRRALLIGIGKYQSLPRLPGSKNDIEMVRQVLLTKYGFPEQHMRILKDEAATRAGVLAALRQLVQETGHQDVVYIHYSGHGSQVEDLNGDEPDDQLDETLVPQDGRTEGIPDITDDELEDILSQFKSNKVVVVLDSCHSGTATRGLEVRVRSVPKDTRLSLYKSSGVRSRAIVPLQSTRYLLMSAAASHEEALDGPVDGRYHGFFTYSLFKSLQSAPLSASSNEVFDGAKLELKRIQNQFGRTSMPEPQAEASLKRLSQPLFEITGSTEKGKNLKSLQARRPWVTVHPLGKDQVLLSHAVSLGALQESVWGLYSQQEVDFHPGNVKAFARVIQTQGIDAIAIIEPPGADIFQNARAILIAPAPQSDSIPVHLRNVAPESRAWLKKELTKRLGDVKIVGAGEFARFVVDVKGKTLHVYSADAAKEVASTPISQSGESIDPLAQVIIQSRNASNLLGLENPNIIHESGLSDFCQTEVNLCYSVIVSF